MIMSVGSWYLAEAHTMHACVIYSICILACACIQCTAEGTVHCVHAFSHVHASSALAEGWLVVCVLHYRYLASFSWSIMVITK